MIVTKRLNLIPATVELTRAALVGSAALGQQLSATVPASWPPEFLDRAAFEYTIARLVEGAEQAGWWLHFAILRENEQRVLIGSAGYKGPPSSDGVVEAGYGIVSEYRRRGLATEVLLGLVAHAFESSAVRKVAGETLPELIASVGVMEKAGFSFVGNGLETGTIRFELTRADYEKRSQAAAKNLK